MMSWPWPEGDPSPRDRRDASPRVTLDVRLAELVRERLRNEPLTRDAPVTVAVQNGVALLGGTVAEPAICLAAERTVRETHGIREVCNMLATAGGDERTADDLETSLIESAQEPERNRLVGSASPMPEQREGGRAGVIAGLAVVWWMTCLLIALFGWTGAAIALLSAVVAAKLFWARRSGR